jgi:hypothetical protein
LKPLFDLSDEKFILIGKLWEGIGKVFKIICNAEPVYASEISTKLLYLDSQRIEIQKNITDPTIQVVLDRLEEHVFKEATRRANISYFITTVGTTFARLRFIYESNQYNFIDIKNSKLIECQLYDMISGQGIENFDIKEFFAVLGLFFSICGNQHPIFLSSTDALENKGLRKFTDLTQKFLLKRMVDLKDKLINDETATFQDFREYLLSKEVYDFCVKDYFLALYEGFASDTKEICFARRKKECCKGLSKSAYLQSPFDTENTFGGLNNLMTWCGDDFKVKPFLGML